MAGVEKKIRKTIQKISNWKTPGHDEIYSFRFKKSPSIQDRLALEMNRCLQGVHVPKWITKGKTTLIQKDPSKGTASKQLHTHKMPTDDVENINSTNKRKYLLLVNKPRIAPRGAKRMPQRIQKYRRVTLLRSKHPK